MNINNTRLPIKVATILALVVYILYAPLDFLHHIATIAHVIYEFIASIIEHFLDKALGLSKFHSQLIVFYSSLAIGIFIAYRCWQYLSRNAWRWFFAIQISLMQSWEQRNLLSKIKWLAIQTGVVLGLIIITLS
ncbi:hypothetical protein [Methylocucumis oryzae]|uniref:Uncharacterized protein n=1 Tax=Methylocucumis oryzae TaxID=1632867 RepID=A0A0F3IKF9_9GAMM|nr:hypothetical protein [Methylocucumis oryzae]KJV07033.1 hypothetical protein VZ94_07355 [Methylocucumis oryzae]